MKLKLTDKEKLKVTIKALKFYANPNRNTMDGEGEIYGRKDEYGNWDHDNGNSAKAALDIIGVK